MRAGIVNRVAAIRPAAAAALSWILIVILLSAVARARPGWLVSVAASPDRIRQGKLWYLVTSGMLVDRPIVISIVCFVTLAALALARCGTRIFWWSAFLGQIAATVLVYVFIVVVRAIVPAAFESVMASPDYGVSTISAAWLGSIAAVSWRRRGRTTKGRFSIAVSCIAVGLFAYTVRPDVSVLSSEHLVAFALGIGAVLPALSPSRRSIWHRAFNLARSTPAAHGHRPSARLAFAVLLPLATAIAAVPAGVAALRQEIAPRLHPTTTRCILDWNTQSNAPRRLVTTTPPMLVSLSIVRQLVRRDYARQAAAPRTVDYCRYILVHDKYATAVFGRWQRGRIDAWAIVTAKMDVPRRGNATAARDGRLRLLPPRGRHLMLSS